MEPKNLKDMEIGETLMLTREIQQRTSVSQVYVKVDDTTVQNNESGEELILPADELVYPFQPDYSAKRL